MSYGSLIDDFAGKRLVGVNLGSAVAGGTGDATEVVGKVVDTFISQGQAFSALVELFWVTTLTAAKTLGYKVTIEESDNNSSWGAKEYLLGSSGAYETVETGADTGIVQSWCYKLDLSGRKRYFRIAVTPDLSHTSTDTVTFGFGAILGGSTIEPILQNDSVITHA
jgi:hypothetical protein